MAKHDPDLSLIFHALSDPTRRALLRRLGAGALPVSVLAAPTGFALPTVMKHLTVLEDAGLIVSEKQGRSRICRAQPEALMVAGDWLAEARAEWAARLDRLDDYVMQLMKDGADDT